MFQGSTEIQQLKLISQLCGSITAETWPEVEQLELYRKFELPKGLNRKIHERLQVNLTLNLSAS